MLTEKAKATDFERGNYGARGTAHETQAEKAARLGHSSVLCGAPPNQVRVYASEADILEAEEECNAAEAAGEPSCAKRTTGALSGCMIGRGWPRPCAQPCVPESAIAAWRLHDVAEAEVSAALPHLAHRRPVAAAAQHDDRGPRR